MPVLQLIPLYLFIKNLYNGASILIINSECQNQQVPKNEAFPLGGGMCGGWGGAVMTHTGSGKSDESQASA